MQCARRVLFVDDDAPIRRAFVRGLGNNGYDIDLAEDAWTAIDLAERNRYAVIATDYRMPGPNGLEAALVLRKLQPDATFIMITGNCDLELTLDAVNLHDIAFVVAKPWKIEELDALVRRGIEQACERQTQRAAVESVETTTQRLAEKEALLSEAAARAKGDVAEALLNSLELRDRQTRRACRRVAAFARTLALEMGIEGQELKAVEQGALLHDIGKIGIPDSILLKPGPLTEAEWAVMRSHPALGARLLEGLADMEGVRDIVLHHHERWGGGGYPSGLVGTDINVGSRILAVADTLDAIVSDRPYRKGASYAVAREEIIRCTGAQFDPEVVEAFLRIPGSIWQSIRRHHDENTRLRVA